jgi:outer membrane protein assembly factor BamB
MLVLAGLLVVAAFTIAADWPQWQGPDRNNQSKETGLLKEWPKGGPKLLWTFKETGLGYSAPVLAGGKLYILGARGEQEYLIALDPKEPKELWKVALGATFTFKSNNWGDGPRTAAAVSGDQIFALGGQGNLVCVTAEGKESWRVSLINDLKGEIALKGTGDPPLASGACGAPLVDGEQVICVPGGPLGTLASLDRKKGTVNWRSKDFKEQAGYSSPVLAEIGGIKQVVHLTANGVAGVDAKNGNLLWFHKKSDSYPVDYVIPTPVVQGDHVYVTVGSGAGCELIQVTKSGDKFEVKEVYSNKNMKNNSGGVVLIDGHVYGYSDKRGWMCQDFLTGKPKWEQRTALKAGSLTAADGHLYLYGEDDGAVVLIEANAKKWTEKGRFELPEKTKHRAPSGRNWTYPVIADGKLYLRDQELLFCYSVK